MTPAMWHGLVDIVGLPRAIELCLTARTVMAAEALPLRLAELVVPAAELDAAVADLVAALLATDAAAARATKALLQQASGRSLAEQAAAERRVQAERIRSPGPGSPSADWGVRTGLRGASGLNYASWHADPS